jgi:Mg2+/citrate symporter
MQRFLTSKTKGAISVNPTVELKRAFHFAWNAFLLLAASCRFVVGIRANPLLFMGAGCSERFF